LLDGNPSAAMLVGNIAKLVWAGKFELQPYGILQANGLEATYFVLAILGECSAAQ
jgi:hypothetical protein